MGMYPAGAISTILLASKLFLWEIPNNWSFEEAATVPVVYLTVRAYLHFTNAMKRAVPSPPIALSIKDFFR